MQDLSVLILGSGPNVLEAREWTEHPFDKIVAINNAWAVREDWDDLIYPFDFPDDRRPNALQSHQRFVTQEDFVPVQNEVGGFLYAGGTMAFTAGYWVLGHYKPAHIAFWGVTCIIQNRVRPIFMEQVKRIRYEMTYPCDRWRPKQIGFTSMQWQKVAQ